VTAIQGTQAKESQQWKRHFIDALPERSVFVEAADLDGDGDLDLAAGGWWWARRTDALSGKWIRHQIGEPLRNLACIYDFDRDGDPDILGTQGVGAAGNHEFVWARNNGAGDFTILSNINYTGSGDFLQGCAVGELGNGIQVALSWHRDGGGIAALNVPQNPSVGTWSTILLSTTVSSPPQGEDLSLGDIDRDGDLDLLLGEKWLRNDGNNWPTFVLGKVTQGEPDRVELTDINGDGRLDAVVSLENGTDVLWYEAPVEPTGSWKRHKVGVVAGQGFSMDAADFDNDGDPDVVIGEHRGKKNNRVILFENAGRGTRWIEHVIDSGPKNEIDHHDGVQSVDMDGDGDLDLISIGWYNPKLWVLENLAVHPTVSKANVRFNHVIIDREGPKDPWAKIIGDIDGDGFNDVVIGGRQKPLVWYAYPDWSKAVIAEGGYKTVDGELGDVDGDGDLDVVMGGLIWYENPRPDSDPAKTRWRAHKIADHPTHDIELADLDSDGDLDVVTRDQSEFGHKAGNRIHLWRQDSGDKWTEKVIHCPHGEGIVLADVDKDGDADVVIGGVWFENTRDIVDGSWSAHRFADWHPSATVQVADINGDARPDVVLSPSELKGQSYKLSWFEAPSNPKRDNWKEHVIVEPIECVIHGLVTADINGDGAMDVVYSEMHQGADPDEVAVLINQVNGTQWTKQVISSKGSHFIRVGDIGNDGDMDIMGANWSGPYQPIEMWENKSGASDSSS
jgi:hypothetical protein